jgi:hypothetical protein
MGVLKKILIACEDLIVPKQKVSNDTVLGFLEDAPAVDTAPTHKGVDELEQYLNHTEMKMDTMDIFAEIFKKESQHHPEALVGSQKLGVLLRENNIEVTRVQLVKKGWVERVKKEGKQKAGWYKATPKLQEKIEYQKIKQRFKTQHAWRFLPSAFMFFHPPP